MIPHIVLAAGLGWCTWVSAAVKPAITSPAEGAVVSSPFAVEVTYGDVEYCDTDGCFDVPAVSVDLQADPDSDFMLLATCDTMTECPNGMASFEVSLAPGQHTLRAVADDGDFSVALSELVTITVEEAATSDTTDGSSSTGDSSSSSDGPGTATSDAPTTGGDTSGGGSTATGGTETSGGAETSSSAGTSGSDSAGDSGGGDSKDDGCGCSTTSAPGGALAWLVAVGLLFRRRR